MTPQGSIGDFTTHDTQPETVLICGDRHYGDADYYPLEVSRAQQRAVHDFVWDLPEGTTVVQGGAKGADWLANWYAGMKKGLTVQTFRANWKRYGRGAGPIRNARMLTEGRPDRVVAFHDDIEKSKGTKNMIRQAEEAGIPTEVRTSL